MNGRLDTRQRVLEAAAEVFAERGYRDATVQDICAGADANVAAVNYYFSSKLNLYRAVWEARMGHIPARLREMREMDAPAEELLARYISRRVEHAFSTGPMMQIRAIIHREMGDPTEINEELRSRYLQPNLDFLVWLIARIAAVAEDDPRVRRCAFSVQSQLVSLSMPKARAVKGRLLFSHTRTPSQAEMTALAEHMTDFCLAGIRAVCGSGRSAS
jgi:AcrR family transcriptional regulator